MSEQGEWVGEVLRTFDAYQVIRKYKTLQEGIKHLRNPFWSSSAKPLVMRLMINDCVRAEIDGKLLLLQVLKINSSGSITFIKPNETNINARYTAKLAAQKAQKSGDDYNPSELEDSFFQQALSASSLQTSKARAVFISPIGELHDPGWKRISSSI